MKTVVAFALATLAFPIVGRAAESPLLAAIRGDDAAAVSRLLAAGESATGRDDTGATALMYAVVYSSPPVVRQLLARGADANAANAGGATALMWAARDAATTRLLLGAGAAIDAKSVDGTTALLAAANHGNADAVRALLAAGADPKAVRLNALLRAVYQAPNSDELQRLFAGAGVDTRDTAQLSPLATALALTDVAAMKRIVAAGGEFSQDLRIAALTLPPLHFAAYHGELDLMRTLLDHGADVNGRTSHGATALMLAAGSPVPRPDAVRLLLSTRPDLTSRDADGRTALDWALTQGETPIAVILREAGAPSTEPPAAPPAVAQPRTARAAVERAIAKLQPAGPTFNDRTKCISCHNQSLPSMAVSLAVARGASVDRTLAAHPTAATLASWQSAREALLLGRPAIGGFVANVTYGLVGLAADHVDPNLTTDAVAITLASLQQADGSWNLDDLRPPLVDQSAVHFTALALRGLIVYMPPGRRDEMKARVARATAYLRQVVPSSTQDEAFKLLGLVWSGVARADISRQTERLLSQQRESGGWAQLSTMAPDAYATGQALYALQAAGVSVDGAAYKRGTAFLLRTQLEDGTWFVRSRAFGFQQYFETGFPHGRDQFISSAATAWAAMALAQSLPVVAGGPGQRAGSSRKTPGL
jgi:ankyrin repeat protein